MLERNRSPACYETGVQSSVFEQILNLNKTFLILREVDPYQKGDIITINELNPGYWGTKTGKVLSAEIGYVTSYRQQENYVVVSLINVHV